MTPEHHIESVRELAEVRTQVANVAQDVTAILNKLDAISILQRDMAKFEQQQLDHHESIKRAFARIESNEGSNGALKESTEKWVNRGIGASIAGTLLIGVIQFLIIDRVRNYEGNQASHGQTLVTVDRRLSWIEYEMKIAKDEKK